MQYGFGIRATLFGVAAFFGGFVLSLLFIGALFYLSHNQKLDVSKSFATLRRRKSIATRFKIPNIRLPEPPSVQKEQPRIRSPKTFYRTTETALTDNNDQLDFKLAKISRSRSFNGQFFSHSSNPDDFVANYENLNTYPDDRKYPVFAVAQNSIDYSVTSQESFYQGHPVYGNNFQDQSAMIERVSENNNYLNLYNYEDYYRAPNRTVLAKNDNVSISNSEQTSRDNHSSGLENSTSDKQQNHDHACYVTSEHRKESVASRFPKTSTSSSRARLIFRERRQSAIEGSANEDMLNEGEVHLKNRNLRNNSVELSEISIDFQNRSSGFDTQYRSS